MNAFLEIDRLKSEWDAVQPLSPENERRLWQKLRLEWNYHSNHIEGNTLTYGETVLLLLHGQTHGNHTLREYEEMKAHDVGIAHLRSLAADRDRLIGPGDIRDLNRIILKEPYWKPTRTPDGQPSRAQVVPGEYKTLPNSVITATGEFFEYASPMEVPARTQALVDWLADALVEDEPPILKIAAKLHHDFVLIHPFDDGNGRVARMLVNYLFLRYGYPPIVVPTEEKSAYLTALRLADAGDLGPLAEFFAQHLERSLKLAIRAGRGENIEERSDVEKQVELFIRQQKAQARNEEPINEVIQALMDNSLIPLLREAHKKLMTLSPLFARTHMIGINGNGEAFVPPFGILIDSDFKKVGPRQKLIINFTFSGYQGEASEAFELQTILGLNFPADGYKVTQDGIEVVSKPYSEPILSEEIDEITAGILSRTFGLIRDKASPRA